MTRHRTLIVSALLASLGPLVGNGLYAVPGSSGESILNEARDGLPMVAYFAYSLELLGFAALTVLFAWLTSFLFQRAPVAAVTTAIAGSAMIAVKLGSAAPMMTVYAMHHTLDPVTAAVLISMNDQAFVISGFLMSVAFTSAGAGLLASEFPRWAAWWAMVAGGLGVVAGVVGIMRPEAYVPIPFLLLLLWMIAVALSSAMGPDRAQPVIATRTTQREVAGAE